jgi:hypothetical protein
MRGGSEGAVVHRDRGMGGGCGRADPAVLGVSGRVPSELTFRRTLQQLDADAFDDLAGAWGQQAAVPGPGGGQVVAVDGETLRGSASGGGQAAREEELVPRDPLRSHLAGRDLGEPGRARLGRGHHPRALVRAENLCGCRPMQIWLDFIWLQTHVSRFVLEVGGPAAAHGQVLVEAGSSSPPPVREEIALSRSVTASGGWSRGASLLRSARFTQLSRPVSQAHICH